MKCALISDTIFLSKGTDFYGMTLTYEFLRKRYLNIYDELVVSTRCKKIENESGDYTGYKIVNGDNISVKPINSYKSIPDCILKRKNIIKEITEVVTNADIVIIRLPGVLGNFACRICNKLKIHYIVEMLACPWDGYRNHTNKLGKMIAPFMYYSTRKSIKKAPKVLYVTNKFLQRRYPTKGEQIACSDVSLNHVNYEILENRMEKINNMSFNEIWLCTVANVEMRYKGHEYAIKAIAKLNSKEHRYKYYLVGNGNQERLKKIAKKYNVEEDVIFLGSLSHEKVFEILDDIDIYIQPSLQEGLPRALLEAMSRACPCMASNVGGNSELLERKYIFKKKSIRAITKILENMNNEELIKLANNAFKESQNYLPEILDNKRKEFYLHT